MTRLAWALIFAALFAATAAAVVTYLRPAGVPPGPRVSYPDVIDLGSRNFGSEAVAPFRIDNTGTAPLHIAGFAASCSCAGVERNVDGRWVAAGPLTLEPGNGVDLSARIAVSGSVGMPQSVTVGFGCDDPLRPAGQIRFAIALVKGAVHAEPRAAAFGRRPPGSRDPIEIRLYDHNVPDVRIVSVQSLNPDRFQVTFLRDASAVGPANPDGGRYLGRVVVTPRGDAGPLAGAVEVRVADPARPADRIEVSGEVVGPFAASPSMLILPRRVNGRAVFDGPITFADPTGRPLQLLEVQAPGHLKAASSVSPAGEIIVGVTATGGRGGTVAVRARTAEGLEATVTVPVEVYPSQMP